METEIKRQGATIFVSMFMGDFNYLYTRKVNERGRQRQIQRETEKETDRRLFLYLTMLIIVSMFN